MKITSFRDSVATLELERMAFLEREPLRAAIAVLEAWVGGQVQSVTGEQPPDVALGSLEPIKAALAAGEPLAVDGEQAAALQAAAWSLYRWAVKSLSSDGWSVQYPRHVGEFGWAWLVEWDEVFNFIRRWAGGAIHEGPFTIERQTKGNKTVLKLSIGARGKELPAADLKDVWERVGMLLGAGDAVVIE